LTPPASSSTFEEFFASISGKEEKFEDLLRAAGNNFYNATAWAFSGTSAELGLYFSTSDQSAIRSTISNAVANFVLFLNDIEPCTVKPELTYLFSGSINATSLSMSFSGTLLNPNGGASTGAGLLWLLALVGWWAMWGK